mgnify:CR=1 FL=1
MEKFVNLKGVAAPFNFINIDTDKIIPKQFLKTIKRTGLGKHLFDEMRFNDDGSEKEDFVLNQEPYQNASVLITGSDFGTGSSREHAVWALKDYGFKAVFSSKFADIFLGNSGKQGLIAGVISEADTEKLWRLIDENPGVQVEVDLPSQEIRLGAEVVSFDIDEYTKWRLTEGLDDIGITLQNEAAIAAYEAKRESWKPKTLPAKGV